MNFGIIAAGDGSRLAAEGVALPKPLVEVGGKPMIVRLLDIMAAYSPERIVVCVNEYMTEVLERLKCYTPAGDTHLIIKVRTTPSSMHTFKEIADELKGRGRFIATTVDTVFDPEAFDSYVRAWEEAPDGVDALMAVTDFIDDEKPLYVAAEGENLRVTAFLDNPAEGVRYVSGGIYGLGDAAVEVLDDCLAAGVARMRNFQRALVGAGLDVRAWPMGKIMDIDHADDIAKANRFLDRS